MMTIAARFDLIMELEEKELVSCAADLMGVTMAAFMRIAAKEKARALVNQAGHIMLTKRDFKALTAALHATFAPNPALQHALEVAHQVKRV